MGNEIIYEWKREEGDPGHVGYGCIEGYLLVIEDAPYPFGTFYSLCLMVTEGHRNETYGDISISQGTISQEQAIGKAKMLESITNGLIASWASGYLDSMCDDLENRFKVVGFYQD